MIVPTTCCNAPLQRVRLSAAIGPAVTDPDAPTFDIYTRTPRVEVVFTACLTCGVVRGQMGLPIGALMIGGKLVGEGRS